MSSIGKLMRQAQRIQQEMERAHQELAEQMVETTAGGGAVKVVARCSQVIESIKINPEAVNPEDITLLEDTVLLAVNDALKQAKTIADERIGAVTGGLNLPGLI
jgi:DNA-binding YbaB/EbfC family protein